MFGYVSMLKQHALILQSLQQRLLEHFEQQT